MLLDLYLSREVPVSETRWHRWNTLFSVPLIDGGRSQGLGQLWRRRTFNGWEYQQDAETEQDYYLRVGY